MHKAKVRSYQWECILCQRVFSSKFCYLLHCKNVHGKSEASSVDDALVRPTKRFDNAAGKQKRRRTRNGDKACPVCKKAYSDKDRLLKHRKLHLKKGKNGLPVEELEAALQAEIQQQDDVSKMTAVVDKIERKIEQQERKRLQDLKRSRDQNREPFIVNTADDMVAAKSGRKRGPYKKKNKDQNKEAELIKKNQLGDGKDNSAENTTPAEKPCKTRDSKPAKKKKRGRPSKEKALKRILPDLAGLLVVTDLSQNNINHSNVPLETELSSIASKKSRRKQKLSRECEICNKVFASRSGLRSHRRIHTGEKPYTCSVCEMGFVRMGHLRQHMCMHTGLWPFKCGACDKGFMSPSRVARHMRVHSEDRPYKCDVCGEGFKESHHLRRHFFVHTGEKRYKCPICPDRFFIQPGNLKIHMKTHEKDISDTRKVTAYPNEDMVDAVHEVKASKEQTTERPNISEQQTALQGLAAISAYRKDVFEMNQGAVETVKTDHGFSGLTNSTDGLSSSSDVLTSSTDRQTNSSDHLTNFSDSPGKQPTMVSDSINTNAQKSEILLQFMPTLAPSLHIQGFQELPTMDQDFLRQFANSVAHELVNS